MKKKFSFSALTLAMFAIFAISALLVTGCDSLLGNDDNVKPDNGNNGGNAPCAHTWEWVIKTPPPDNGEDAVEKDSIGAQRCTKCNTTGRTVTIPAGSDVNEFLSEFEEDVDMDDTSGNDDIDISDDELESILSSTGTNPYAVVGPLVTTKWAQNRPFNNLFPLRSSGSSPVATDCTITATAQIIAYHKHPIRGTGQSTKLMPQGVTVPLIDFSATNFDWNNMLDNYRSDGKNSTEQQRNAVATLMYHVAAARGASNLRLLYPNHFGFDKGIQQHYREFYTDAEWEAMIRQQLDLKLPVYYYSKREGGGHGFVIDGYDSQGRFHVNWGWKGGYDGWYPINGLKPREGRFYDRNQKIIINIKPDKGSIGSNEFGLENFKVDKTLVAQKEILTFNIKVRSFGIFPGGQRGVALTDTNGNIVDIIRIENFNSLTISAFRTTTTRCIVPDTVSPGQYQLRIVTRMDGEQEWKIITASAREAGVPNAIPVTITAGEANGGGYEQALTSFTASQNSASHEDQFTVTFATRNFSSEIYPGGLQGAALVDNNNNIVAVLGNRSRAAINPGSTRVLTTINCTIPYSVLPGQYRLRIVIRTIDNEEWKIATMSLPDIPTSINFTVTSGVRSPFLDFFHSVAAYRSATNDMEVIVNQNLTISQLVSIPAPALAGATLTIRSANESQRVTLTRGVSGNLFTVTNGASLILKDIIIDGGSGGAFADNGGGSLVRLNGGSFTMNAGTVLRNNTNTNTATATLGGGVNANTNSTFTMNGGTISGNIAGGNGGGLIVTNSAVSTINGGEISGNKGSNGGGVRISAGGVFTLVNGKINNNIASSDGGGVSIADASSVFNFNGGELSGNSGRDGGGIRMAGGTFTMQNGKITGNTASLGGGGASVSGTSSVFNIYGGSISGNTSVTNAGGGAAAWGGAVINMTGGEIIANNAPSGAELRLSNSGGSSTFNQSGGLVAGIGANISGIISISGSTHNLNTGEGAPNNAVVIAWNRASGTLDYTVGTNTDLTVSAGAAATWENQSGVLGISYANGSNTGWIKQW